jgi:hypothetical protein
VTKESMESSSSWHSVGWILSTTSDWRIAAFWWGKHKRASSISHWLFQVGSPSLETSCLCCVSLAGVGLGWVALSLLLCQAWVEGWKSGFLCFCAPHEWSQRKYLKGKLITRLHLYTTPKYKTMPTVF